MKIAQASSTPSPGVSLHVLDAPGSRVTKLLAA
jgi:hypothetical protein